MTYTVNIALKAYLIDYLQSLDTSGPHTEGVKLPRGHQLNKELLPLLCLKKQFDGYPYPQTVKVVIPKFGNIRVSTNRFMNQKAQLKFEKKVREMLFTDLYAYTRYRKAGWRKDAIWNFMKEHGISPINIDVDSLRRSLDRWEGRQHPKKQFLARKNLIVVPFRVSA